MYKTNFYPVPFEYARRKLYIRESTKNGLTLVNIYYEDKIIEVHELSLEKGKIVSPNKYFMISSTSKKRNRRVNNRKTSLSKFNKSFTRPLSYYNQLDWGL